MIFRSAALAACLFISLAKGDVIVSETAAAPGDQTNIAVASWWQTPWSSVTIQAMLRDTNANPASNPATGVAYLMNGYYGPGSTSANQALAAYSFSITNSSYSLVTLFGGPISLLGQAGYGLIIVPTSSGLAWASAASPTETTGLYVTHYFDDVGSTIASYPPASAFTPTGKNLLFAVIGTQLPEPGSAGMAALSLSAMAVLMVYRRSRV